MEANRGQVMWSVRGGDNLSLIGRAEQADDDEAVSSTYACQSCCPDTFDDGWVDSQEMEEGVGDTEQFTARQQDRNCYGTVLSSYAVTANWSSSNTSVATVDGEGLATAVAPGSADISANWYVTNYLVMVGSPGCEESVEEFFASSVFTVQALWTLGTTISFISPANLTVKNGDKAILEVSVTAQTGMPSNASVRLDVSYMANGSVSFSVNPASLTLTTAQVPAGSTVTFNIEFTVTGSGPPVVTVTGVAALGMAENSRIGTPPQRNSSNMLSVVK